MSPPATSGAKRKLKCIRVRNEDDKSEFVPISYSRRGVLPSCGSVFEITASDCKRFEAKEDNMVYIQNSNALPMAQHVSIWFDSKPDEKTRFLVHEFNMMKHLHENRAEYLEYWDENAKEVVAHWNEKFGCVEKVNLRNPVERHTVIDHYSHRDDRIAFVQLIGEQELKQTCFVDQIMLFFSCSNSKLLQLHHPLPGQGGRHHRG